MYDLINMNFTERLREYRKINGYSLEYLGKKVGKAKTTILKYENGNIVPDITTILELCNALHINLNDLFVPRNDFISRERTNPFDINKLYLYYYTDNKLISSVIEILEKDNKVKLYNGVKNLEKYKADFSYYYEGTLKFDKTIGYFNFQSASFQGLQAENVQISFNIRWSNKFRISKFFILGLTPNSIPVVKKGILTASPIKDVLKYNNDLLITKQDLNYIKSRNCWILDDTNYDHFFYDIYDSE